MASETPDGSWAHLHAWRAESEAATAVEYAIMAGFIAAVMIVAVVFLGQESKGTYDCTKESIESNDAHC